MRRPSQNELLRAEDFAIFEGHPNTSEPLRVVENEPYRLTSRLSRTPALQRFGDEEWTQPFKVEFRTTNVPTVLN